jgi:acetyltransferase-like isoleucine patch superfamily enzyme
MVRILIEMIKGWLLLRSRRQGLQIGEGCRVLAWPTSCFGSEPYLVSIGNRVTITSKVQFITHDGATWVFRNQTKYQDVIKYGRIIVHDNCFIGFSSIILPGVSIGPNSVVAAGALVTKDIPSGEVWGGVPARRICSIEEYAMAALDETPSYDRATYKRDKRSELLRIYPYPW